MKQKINAPSVPTVNLCVNKSRIKLYNKAGDMPTYYLQKGQEFQFELFNPTSDVILAKIHLNSKSISQSGLVLNPGERVFLDRYLDIPKKFLFDTYEVSNTDEVKKAIQNNGDVKVEFFREIEKFVTNLNFDPSIYKSRIRRPSNYDYFPYQTSSGNISFTGGMNLSNSFGDDQPVYSTVNTIMRSANRLNVTSNNCFFNHSTDAINKSSQQPSFEVKKASKSIETGRIEKGSDSKQVFEYVSKDFSFLPFHTVEYKLLPVSQKVNTSEDIKVKRYCTNCGHKLGKTDKFCASCGQKA